MVIRNVHMARYWLNRISHPQTQMCPCHLTTVSTNHVCTLQSHLLKRGVTQFAWNLFVRNLYKADVRYL